MGLLLWGGDSQAAAAGADDESVPSYVRARALTSPKERYEALHRASDFMLKVPADRNCIAPLLSSLVGGYGTYLLHGGLVSEFINTPGKVAVPEELCAYILMDTNSFIRGVTRGREVAMHFYPLVFNMMYDCMDKVHPKTGAVLEKGISSSLPSDARAGRG